MFKFTFADGFQIYAHGLDRVEKQHLIAAHGKLVSKVPA